MIQLDAHQLLRNDQDWILVLNRLDDLNARISLVVTGGGSGTLARCFRRSGASRHFVEAVIPYSRRSVSEFLGGKLNSPSVSEDTAIGLAAMAKRRARRLADDDSGIAVGISLTAALPTVPPRDHQEAIYVALISDQKSETWSVTLGRNEFDRQTAEEIADALIFRALETL